jgi:hypothetical protein
MTRGHNFNLDSSGIEAAEKLMMGRVAATSRRHKPNDSILKWRDKPKAVQINHTHTGLRPLLCGKAPPFRANSAFFEVRANLKALS